MNLAPASQTLWASVSGLGLLGLVLVPASRRKNKMYGVIVALLLGGAIAISGCGGGSSARSGGTPPGNYTVTVTAKDANGATPSNTSPLTVTFTVY
jgi:hypothetical protein